MKIEQFSKNDIIHRIAPAVDGDKQWIGKRLRFLGFAKKNVIFVRVLNPSMVRNRLCVIAGIKWFDDFWELYPENLYQELRTELKEKREAIEKEEAKKEEKEEKKEEEEE